MFKSVELILRRSPMPPILVACFLLAVGVACSKKEEAPPPPPPEVQVAEVMQKDVPIYEDWVGSIEARRMPPSPPK